MSDDCQDPDRITFDLGLAEHCKSSIEFKMGTQAQFVQNPEVPEAIADELSEARREYWEKRRCRTCTFFGPRPDPGPHEYRLASDAKYGTCRVARPPWELVVSMDWCGYWNNVLHVKVNRGEP